LKKTCEKSNSNYTKIARDGFAYPFLKGLGCRKIRNLGFYLAYFEIKDISYNIYIQNFLKIIKFFKLKTIFLKKLNFFARVLIWFLEQVVMMSSGYKKTIFSEIKILQKDLTGV